MFTFFGAIFRVFFFFCCFILFVCFFFSRKYHLFYPVYRRAQSQKGAYRIDKAAYRPRIGVNTVLCGPIRAYTRSKNQVEIVRRKLKAKRDKGEVIKGDIEKRDAGLKEGPGKIPQVSFFFFFFCFFFFE